MYWFLSIEWFVVYWWSECFDFFVCRLLVAGSCGVALGASWGVGAFCGVRHCNASFTHMSPLRLGGECTTSVFLGSVYKIPASVIIPRGLLSSQCAFDLEKYSVYIHVLA